MTRILVLTLGIIIAALPAQALAKSAPEPAAESGSTRNLYMMLIQKARADGRPRAALAYLDDFDRQHPGDLEARLLRINCLLDLGQVEPARAALAQVPASRRDGEVSAVQGHVFAAEGHWAEAATHYTAALARSPANPLTGNALGYALLRTGQIDRAVETLKGAHDLAPTNTVIRNNLLLALTLAGRHGEAEAILGTVSDPTARTMLRGQVADQSARLSIKVAQP